jgi:H+/Cl- antiporter ClcA
MVGGKKPLHNDVYQAYESVSYIIPDTAAQEAQFMHMGHVAHQRRRLFLWVRYAITGIMVSCVISGALRICHEIEYARVKTTKYLLDDNNISSAWLFWVGTSLGMNLFACFLVLLQPAAASSGIPGLIAFLNGVEPMGGKSPITKKKTSFTSLKTMGAKFVGMLASIPSGLCIGPEGPIIHISALVAFWSTHFVHSIEERLFGKAFDTESEAEKRDFLATGAACGICTAFRAPLAGTLFVVEEAGSFFTTQHLEYTFFSCLVAYWMQWVFAYYFGDPGSTDAKFQQQTGYFCNVDNPLNMVAYLVMALIGGVLGALFNQIVEKLNHLRAHHVNKHGCRRFMEVFLITLLTGTVVIFLPMSANCRILTREIMLEDGAGCFPEKDLFQVSYGAVSHSFMEELVSIAETGNLSSSSASSSSSTSSASSTNSRRLSDIDDKILKSGRRMLLGIDDDFNIQVLPPDRRLHLRHLATATSSTGSTSSTDSTTNTAGSNVEYDAYYGEDVGSGQTSIDLIQNLKVHLKNHRVMKSHRGYKEYDILMLDNIATHGPYIHIHYEHTYTCGKKSHSYNDMAMLWLNGGAKGVKTLMQRGFPHQISEQTLVVFLVVYFTLAAITSGTHVPAGLVVPMLLIGGSFGRLFGLLWLKIKAGMCDNYTALGDDYDMYSWAAEYRWIVRDCKLPDPGTFAVIGMASFMGGSGRISVMLAIVMLELTADAGLIAPVGIVCILSMLVGNMFNHGLYHGLIPIMNIPYLNATPAHVMFVTRVSEIMKTKLVCLPQHCSVGELKILRKRIEMGRCTHNAFPVIESYYHRKLCGLLDTSNLKLLFEHLESGDKILNERIRGPDGTIDLTQYCDRSPLTVASISTVSRAYEVFRKLGLRHLMVTGPDGMLCGVVTRKDLMIFKIVEQKERELLVVCQLQEIIRKKLEKKNFYHMNGLHRRSSIIRMEAAAKEQTKKKA